MAGIPGAKASPDWERPIVSPDEKPEFEWSVSRAGAYLCQPPKSRKSNEQLIAALVKAANLFHWTAKMLAGQITFWDSMRDYKRSAIIVLDTDGYVFGGRAGRDDKFVDVPNHFVRDCLMNHIQTKIPENDREASLRAVFDDLSSSEIELYAAAVLEKQRALAEAQEPFVRIPKSCKKPNLAERCAREEAAFDAIDTSIDLTPKPGYHVRNYDAPPPLPKTFSVLSPYASPTDAELDSFSYEVEIDRDCDQIRAMTKIFIQEEEEWTLKQCRRALGYLVSRVALVNFLKCKGPAAGKKQHVYQLSWEFFKRRELLGHPTKQRVDNALKEVDSNRQERKRKSDGGDARDTKRGRVVSSTGTTWNVVVKGKKATYLRSAKFRDDALQFQEMRRLS